MLVICVLFNIICPFITTVCAITKDMAQREVHVGWNSHRCQAIRYLDGVSTSQCYTVAFAYPLQRL